MAEPAAAGLGTVFDRSTCGRTDCKSLWAATAMRCTRLAARGPRPGRMLMGALALRYLLTGTLPRFPG